MQENLDITICDLITEALCDGDQVALPGFGTFSVLKTDEQIISDHKAGRSTLLPPNLAVEFTPALKLIKLVKNTSNNTQQAL